MTMTGMIRIIKDDEDQNMDKKMIRNIDSCGRRIDALRDIHNETKTELAAVIGVSRGHLTDLLQDRYRWSEDKVLAVAEHYGVSFSILFYGNEKISDIGLLEEPLEHIRNVIRTLPEREKRETWKKIVCEMVDIYLDAVGRNVDDL